MAMAEGEWGNDGTEIEEMSSDDEGGNATVTEGEDNADEEQDGTQIAPQDTEVEADAVRMMEGEEEGDPVTGSAAAALPESSGRNGAGGNRAAALMDENEQTPPTQIDSPHADSPAAEDRAKTDPLERRRTPSPPRKSGHGSGLFLSGGVATAVNGGGSSGFLSSAEPSAKAARARAATSMSSPHPVPRGWLDDQLKAAGAELAGGAKAALRTSARRQHESKGNGGGASMHESAAPVVQTLPKKAQALPKKPSPAKAAAGSGGWIRTKGSPSKGRHAQQARDVAAEDQRAGAPDTQEGSVAQSILAIGVPHERRVVDPPHPRPTDTIRGGAGGAGAAAAAADDDDVEEEEDEDEETEMSAVGIIQGTVNSQELKPNEFSQIRKGCSQQDHDFERMMDAEIAAAAASQQNAECAGERGGDETEGFASPAPGGRYGGGDVVSSKRKKMRSSAHAAAAAGGGGTAEASRGGGPGNGVTGSRTPGAYMRLSSKRSAKNRKSVPR